MFKILKNGNNKFEGENVDGNQNWEDKLWNPWGCRERERESALLIVM